jgi:mono/diheme cytochrome c family protein
VRRAAAGARRAVALLLLATLAGCDQAMIQQKRYDTEAPVDFFPDGTEARPLPDGTVAQGDLDYLAAVKNPPPVTRELIERGHEGFNAICAPCHGFAGDGDGVVVQRGFPAPPSYHIARLRSAPAQHLFDVITNGYGVMYSYADRVAPADRWAIVAYIRALQLSRHATLAEAPEAKELLK